MGGIRRTVVACWTASQQVERSILHQRLDSNYATFMLLFKFKLHVRDNKHHRYMYINGTNQHWIVIF